jgi:O-antigen ligase
MVLFAIAICLAIALAGIFRPFLGLVVLMTIHFLQPGELIAALAPFRIELVYATVLLLGFAIHRFSTPATPLLSNRIVVASILFLGAACLSVPFAIWKGGALDSTIEMAKLIALLFLVTGLIDDHGQLNKFLWLQVALLAWFTCSGLYAFLHGQFYALGKLERAEGVSSLAGGPNQLAGLLLCLLPFLIVRIRCSKNILVSIMLIGWGGLAIATMVFTGSRIAMLGLATLALYYIAKSRHKVRNFAACLALSCAVWFSIPEIYQQRYLTVMSYAAGGKLDPSNAYRIEIWRAGWKMFADHPIVGVGTGQFGTAFGLIYSQKAHGAWMNPHNLLIQVVCELGLVGLLTFAYFLVQIAKAIRLVLRMKGDSSVQLNYEIAVACNVMLLAMIVMSLVSHTLYRPYWYLLAGFAGANRAVALARQSNGATAPSEEAPEQETSAESEPSPGSWLVGQTPT